MGLLVAACVGRAESFRLESTGARGGLSVNQPSREFYQAEAFANWALPWSWDLGKQWSLKPRLDFTAGWLSDAGKDAAIGTLGPVVVLGRERLPLTLDAGVSPTLLSRHEFAEADLGSAVQFTSHVGLEWQFAPRWSLGYRLQHMSNAHLATPNPGINMHLVGLSYRF